MTGSQDIETTDKTEIKSVCQINQLNPSDQVCYMIRIQRKRLVCVTLGLDYGMDLLKQIFFVADPG